MARIVPRVALSLSLLAGIAWPASDQQATKRKPRNALEDINRVGDRNVTGILNLYSRETERRMGLAVAAGLESRARLVSDPVVSEYVNRLGQNIAKNSDLKTPIKIRAIHSSTVNAFAIPGHFYVLTGLIRFATTEAELAGVMAHEIAHIAGRHSTRQMSRQELIASTTQVFFETHGRNDWKTLLTAAAATTALSLGFSKFSRTFESKADFLGLQYMYKTGYDPLAFIAFFERGAASGKKRPGTIAKLFSTHPPDAKRILKIQKAIDELLPPRAQYAISNTEFESIKQRLGKIEGWESESDER